MLTPDRLGPTDGLKTGHIMAMPALAVGWPVVDYSELPSRKDSQPRARKCLQVYGMVGLKILTSGIWGEPLVERLCGTCGKPRQDGIKARRPFP